MKSKSATDIVHPIARFSTHEFSGDYLYVSLQLNNSIGCDMQKLHKRTLTYHRIASR